jgi:putative transcriptional regulator
MNNRLRVLRAERAWSQEECANQLGVSRQTVNAIERERFDPTLRLAMRIARLFDQSIEDIFLDDPAVDAPRRSPATFRRRAERGG